MLSMENMAVEKQWQWSRICPVCYVFFFYLIVMNVEAVTPDISAKQIDSITLKSDGTVWAWGNNNNAQLGDASRNENLTPIQISGLSDMSAIAAGYSHVVALKNDGTVWALGNNFNGQLGNSTSGEEVNPTPSQVTDLTNVIAISAGWRHSVALKADGTVWTWGGEQ
jgi:alpha-tubulin suppressor-like RCC1 family protein